MITTAPPLSARLIVMSLLLFRFLNVVNRDNGSFKLDFNSESLPKSDNSSGRLETLERYRRLSFLLGGNAKFKPTQVKSSHWAVVCNWKGSLLFEDLKI